MVSSECRGVAKASKLLFKGSFYAEKAPQTDEAVLLKIPTIGLPYRRISRFAGQLASCLQAGLSPRQALQTSGKYLPQGKLRIAVLTAAERVERGECLTDALDEGRGVWPPFFLPTLRVGEETGRVDEVLRYLEKHCRQLAPVSTALHRLWLLPTGIFFVGGLLRVLLELIFGRFGSAAFAFVSLGWNLALLASLIYLIVASPLRPLIDHLRIALPFWGSVERDTAMQRFFATFALAYAASGQRVGSMIRLAAQTVTNSAIQSDLRRAAAEAERGATLSAAFRIPARITAEELHQIEVGETAGRLEECFNRIAEQASERLQGRLQLFETIAVRLTLFIVGLSLLGLVARLS